MTSAIPTKMTLATLARAPLATATAVTAGLGRFPRMTLISLFLGSTVATAALVDMGWPKGKGDGHAREDRLPVPHKDDATPDDTSSPTIVQAPHLPAPDNTVQNVAGTAQPGTGTGGGNTVAAQSSASASGSTQKPTPTREGRSLATDGAHGMSRAEYRRAVAENRIAAASLRDYERGAGVRYRGTPAELAALDHDIRQRYGDAQRAGGSSINAYGVRGVMADRQLGDRYRVASPAPGAMQALVTARMPPQPGMTYQRSVPSGYQSNTYGRSGNGSGYSAPVVHPFFGFGGGSPVGGFRGGSGFHGGGGRR